MNETQTRFLTLERKAGSDSVFPAVATTETPVDRGDYFEVLDMSRVDLSRAPLPFIESHDTGRLNIGLAENFAVDGEKLRCDVRLGGTTRAKELASDIAAGIVTGVSIGYQVSDQVQDGEIEGKPVFRFAFAPYELSAVSVPADVNAGFYRQGYRPMESQQTTKQPQRAQNDESNRVAAIRALADRFHLGSMGMKAIADGWTLEDFNKRALEEVGRQNQVSRQENHVGAGQQLLENGLNTSFGERMSPESPFGRAMNDYSLLNVLRGLSDPGEMSKAGLEVEISQELKRMAGIKNQRGVLVPFDVLQTRSVTYSGTGSNLVATDHLSGSFIDVLRNKSHVMSLNPTVLRNLEGDVAIPRKTAGATAYWIAGDDADQLTTSDPTLDQVTLSPKTVGGAVTFSHRMIVQGSPDVEAMVRQDLADMLAVEIDHKAINGDGTGNTPTGILGTTGINAQSFAVVDPSYDELVGMETLIADDNAEVERMAYLCTPAMREHFKTTPKQGSGVEGNFIWDAGMVNGYRCLSTKNMPAGTVLLGDWSQLIVGFWGGILLDADPYGANFLKGSVTVRVMADVDVSVRHPGAFCAGSN